MTGKYLTVLCTFNIKCAIAEVDEKKMVLTGALFS